MVSEENLKFLRQREGQYIVGTPKAMLRQFEQYLTDAEWAFRITKDELEIRPIWRQTDRVLAPILICFLAYVLWKTLAQWMLGRAWATPRGRCWRSWPRSRAATWCCPPARKRAAIMERSAAVRYRTG